MSKKKTRKKQQKGRELHVNPAESCEEKVLFLGGKKMTKLQKAQGIRMAYKKHIFWSLKKSGLKSDNPNKLSSDQRLLHIIFCALGGPILGFLGVGLAGTLANT